VDLLDPALDASLTANESRLSDPTVSEPAFSGERLRKQPPSEGARTSLILPRLPQDLEAEPDSAKERFRRAAEIGQKARQEAANKKKG
jgi:hypothetical protein